MAHAITKNNFEEVVLKSDKPVLIDFWAAWCGPCRTVAPVIDQLSVDFDGRAVVGKINVDEEPELSEKYRIMTIPSLFIFKNGEVVEKFIGSRTADEIGKIIEKYI